MDMAVISLPSSEDRKIRRLPLKRNTMPPRMKRLLEKKPLPGLAAVCRLSSMSLRSLVVKAFQNGMNCSGVIWVVSFQLVNKS